MFDPDDNIMSRLCSELQDSGKLGDMRMMRDETIIESIDGSSFTFVPGGVVVRTNGMGWHETAITLSGDNSEDVQRLLDAARMNRRQNLVAQHEFLANYHAQVATNLKASEG